MPHVVPTPSSANGSAHSYWSSYIEYIDNTTGLYAYNSIGYSYDFMDREARMGATADKNGHSQRGTGNPADYQAVLTQIFNNIITNPKVRLVK